MPTKPGKIWIFDRVPLTLNKLLRAHWAEKKRDLESWKGWVLGVAGNRRGFDQRARVKVTVYRARQQDPDNAVGSVKPLIDALNRLGWLVDDTTRWLDLEVEERIDRKEPRTEVYWEPL